MKHNEIVWRVLVDHALSESRRWATLADLAEQAKVPVATAHFATHRLAEIGAVTRYPGGGFSVVNVEKVLTLLCAWRNLKSDTLGVTTRDAARELTQSPRYVTALGGPDAAVHWLGGRNTIADFSESLLYVHLPVGEVVDLPEGHEVTIVSMDHQAAGSWTGFSSVAQTLADLFATPGWQASEFRLALHDRYFGQSDWDQKVSRRA